MWVTILLGHSTMGCPPGMTDTDMVGSETIRLGFYLEISDSSHGLDNLKMFFMIQYADSCAIIPAIFEALESCEYFLCCLSRTTKISKNSTHMLFL